jgi:hypothetical protein
MLSEDGITVRQALQITSATKSAHSRHRAYLFYEQKKGPNGRRDCYNWYVRNHRAKFNMQACVYTCLMGNSEALNEQPVATSSRLPFICFTDSPDLRSKTWDVRTTPRLFNMDPVRSQRAVKILPYEYLPEFDASLYIDNSVLLEQAPDALIEKNLPPSGFCLVEHSFRATVLDEFLEVAAQGLDDQSRIFEQLNHYTIDCPEVLQEKPYWGAILLRDHHNLAVRKMLEIWFAHVQRYSRRDQLSVNLAFRLAGLTPDVLHYDNYKSEYHSWPLKVGGYNDAGLREPSHDLMPVAARINALENALLEERRKTYAMAASAAQRDRVLAYARHRNEALLASTSWRVTAPLRGLSRMLRALVRREYN